MKNLKIMFVCLGNICRSPMAEVIFKDMLAKDGITGVTVLSSATSYDEIYNGIGNPIYPPAERELNKHGLTGGSKRATKLLKTDYDNYDLFIGMDDSNIKNMYAIFGGDKDGKVKKLLDYAGTGKSVSDPYFTNQFDVTYNDVYTGCLALKKALFGE